MKTETIKKNIEKLEEYLTKSKISSLEPQICTYSDYGVFYPVIERVLDVDRNETKFYANSLFPYYFSKKEDCSWIYICNNCLKPTIKLVNYCPDCRRIVIEKGHVLKDESGVLVNKCIHECEICGNQSDSFPKGFVCETCGEIYDYEELFQEPLTIFKK